MKKILFGIIAAAMAISAEAQIQPTPVSVKGNSNIGRVDMRQHRYLSDKQIADMSKRVSSNPITSTDVAAKMLRKALANTPVMAKGGANKTTTNITERLYAASYNSEDTVYSEGWESYDGTFKWIPEAWKQQGIAECIKEEGICPTWAGVQGDGYYIPYATEGRSYMMCDLSDNAQDEWLVSPTIGQITASNYLFFDLGFAPLYTYKTDVKTDEKGNVESIDYDLTQKMYDVEVMITTKTRSASFNEDDYTVVFRLSDVVNEIIINTDLDNREELTKLLLTNWHHFQLSLKEYEGQNIRVAFRYKGSKGSYVTLDAVRVSDLLPTAKYERPEGTFYTGFGFTDNQPYLVRWKNVFMPAYTKTVWPNYSNSDCESFQWTFDVDDNKITSSDYDFAMQSMNLGQYYWPTLTANGGSRQNSFKGQVDVPTSATSFEHHGNGTIMVGGNTHVVFTDGVETTYNVGNFDASKPYGPATGPDKNPVFGVPTSTFWAGYNFTKTIGIANVYEKPIKPYVFSSVVMPMADYLNWGNSKLTCSIYKAEENANGLITILDEVISEVEQSGEMTLGNNGDKGYAVIFNFAEPMVIDSPIAVRISGFDGDGIMSLQPITQLWNNDNGKGYAFVLLKNEKTGGIWWCEIAGALAAFNTAGNMAVSHCIGLNAVFPFLHSVNGNTFDALTVGEKKDFEIHSYFAPEKNGADDKLNGWEIICSEPWVKADKTINAAEAKAFLNITVDPLPEGIAGRSATVKVKALGCEETITVNQGNVSAIENITVDSNSAINGTYNIAGQSVNSNNAKRGLFIENRSGKFVKVLK